MYKTIIIYTKSYSFSRNYISSMTSHDYVENFLKILEIFLCRYFIIRNGRKLFVPENGNIGNNFLSR